MHDVISPRGHPPAGAWRWRVLRPIVIIGLAGLVLGGCYHYGASYYPYDGPYFPDPNYERPYFYSPWSIYIGPTYRPRVRHGVRHGVRRGVRRGRTGRRRH